MRFLRLCLATVALMSISGCAVFQGCKGSVRYECDANGENCKWVAEVSCPIGPQPRPSPTPIPPWQQRSATPSPAAAATFMGLEDTDGNGLLDCQGEYDPNTGVLTGSCT